MSLPLMGGAEITSTLYEFQSAPLDEMDTPLLGSFRVSDNGKYAVGYDSDYCLTAYIWDSESKQITHLTEYTGSKSDAAIANDVADDGTIAGAYIATVEGESGTVKCWHPGLKPLNGDWIDLPLPSSLNTKYMGSISSYDYANMAKRISPDGKIVCGEVYVTYDDGGSTKSRWLPILWKVENGEAQILQEFADGGYTQGQTFIPYDMTDDGSIIVGMAENERGEQLPAMYRDGEFEFLEGPTLVWVEEKGRYVEYDADGNEVDFFWDGGIANCIDDDLKVYYYYIDGWQTLRGVVLDLTTNYKEVYEDQIVTCGTRGVVLGLASSMYGPAAIIDGGVAGTDVSKLASVGCVSDDGTVLAGSGIGSAMGEVYSCPALLVLSESIYGSVAGLQLQQLAVAKRGDNVVITGDYDKAEMYDVAGNKVATISGGSLDVSGYGAGLYLVRVSKGSDVKVTKILK